MNFITQHVEGGMVTDEMMKPLDNHPPVAIGIVRHDEVEQRRLAEIEALAARIEALGQLLSHGTIGRIQLDLSDVELSAAKDNLRRMRKPMPQECSAQDVVPIDDMLDG
ncbi:HAMP domain-containing protein [Rhodanobacter sp. K2T2]|nr:HAMP domain-containing protein [Rhodanobacter sp. K2T2]